MQLSFNWENLPINQIIENKINKLINKNFSKYRFLDNVEISISKGSGNSRYYVKLLATTINTLEKLRSEGVSCDIIPATNDLIFNFKKRLSNYDVNAYQKKIKLEEKWKSDTVKNREFKKQREDKYKEIVEENKRRSIENERIRRVNEQIKRDYLIQKDLAKKIYKQQLIDEQTRYELEKDFLERQKALEEKRLLQEARLREVARIQKEIITKDLQLQEQVKDKQKELRELKEENNEVIKIKNQILNIESSDFDEIWAANEPFQNEETGQWYYHDGEGNFYESNADGEWVENTIEIKKQLDAIRTNKVNILLDEKDKAQIRQEKVTNDDYLKEKNQSLDVRTLESLEKKLDQNEEKLKKLVIEKEEKIYNLQETHNANEPWLGDDNKYYYHDGKGKYFTTDDNNRWVETTNPEVTKINNEYNNEKEIYVTDEAKEINLKSKKINKKVNNKDNTNTKDNKKNKDSKDDGLLPKPNEAYEFNGRWYYFDENDNYFTTNENNEWVSTINPHLKKTKNDDVTRALEDNYDHSEPFQDENGIWWYIDENNQYYYGDENGNWIKWEEKNN